MRLTLHESCPRMRVALTLATALGLCVTNWTHAETPEPSQDEDVQTPTLVVIATTKDLPAARREANRASDRLAYASRSD
jgi:hypothetical protein